MYIVASYLVPEDLDLAVGSVDWLCCVTVQILVRVHYHVERVALDSLLRGKLGAEAVDAQHQLKGGEADRTKDYHCMSGYVSLIGGLC